MSVRNLKSYFLYQLKNLDHVLRYAFSCYDTNQFTCSFNIIIIQSC